MNFVGFRWWLLGRVKFLGGIRLMICVFDRCEIRSCFEVVYGMDINLLIFDEMWNGWMFLCIMVMVYLCFFSRYICVVLWVFLVSWVSIWLYLCIRLICLV